MSKNPVILMLHFRGWTIRQYQNGKWDAIETPGPGVGLTPGFSTFADVMDYLLKEVKV